MSFECLSSFVYLFISIYVRLIFCIPHCLHSHFNFHHRRRNLGESELKFEMLERNARRLKNGKFPKMPKCPSDIIEAFKDPTIYDRYALNLRKTKPFYIDTICAGTSYFTIFASHQVIDMINKHIPPSRRNYLIDGTFKVTPIGGYYQLLIIQIECANDVSVLLCNEIIIHNVTVFYQIEIANFLRLYPLFMS